MAASLQQKTPGASPRVLRSSRARERWALKPALCSVVPDSILHSAYLLRQLPQQMLTVVLRREAIHAHTQKAPRRGRLGAGCKRSPLASRGRLGRVSVCFTFDLSGAWQARKAVTSLPRDARGLTSAVVTAARVMQPRGSTIGTSGVAYRSCGYGVMFAPHHRVHCGFDAFRAHLHCAHRLE